MMYKITNEKVAIPKEGRLLPPKRLKKHAWQKLPDTISNYRKYLFYPRTIRDWNTLPPGVVTVPSVEAFKAELNSYIFLGGGQGFQSGTVPGTFTRLK
jgi:hypothetical protein